MVAGLGTRFASMLASIVVVETVFSYPGMGKILFDSVMGNDFVVSIAILMLFIYLNLAVSLLGGLVYGRFAPQGRYPARQADAGAGPLAAAGPSALASLAEPTPRALRVAGMVIGACGLGLIAYFCYVGLCWPIDVTLPA